MTSLSSGVLAAHLERCSLTDLFVEELGWDRLRGAALHRVRIGDTEVELEGLAQKRDVPVFLCRTASLPPRDVRRRIERELSRVQLEHLLVFLEEGSGAQIWQWVKREPGRPDRVREHAWQVGSPVEPLRQKLEALQFTLEEEDEPGRITVNSVTGRLQRAFDADKITKRFFTNFEDQHHVIQAFLDGLPDDQRSWYASVTLNRLMFVWFIQKRGFVAGNPNYLQDKLAESRQRGTDLFFKDVLGPLFFRGFACPKVERSDADTALLGDVPYLNGGLFQEHQIEREHGEAISLPDRAFADLFSFFESWTWHLDERDARGRAPRNGQAGEINPDVLGYIFEKYINNKQMGAYYTKEDVTEYICAATVLPRLLDKVEALIPLAFQGEDAIWRLLAEDPDRYIWSSLRHGIELDPPEQVAAALGGASSGKFLDKPASADFGLPTESWREALHRHERVRSLRTRLQAGEIASSDELVTCNLDIHRFVQDAITAASEDQLRSWWQALTSLTVLDPACGSGAFLFAALNLLEPLYTQLFDAMGTAVVDAKLAAAQGGTPLAGKVNIEFFQSVLAEAAKHSNAAYFVLRQVALNNLYGVDIMEEAAEICKLRLFLKLIAQLADASEIEPLPDLDFNIKSGNSLIGFASREQLREALKGELETTDAFERIEDEAEQAALSYRQFKDAQLAPHQDAGALRDLKTATEGHLAEAASQANGWLADRYGKGPQTPAAYDGWLRSHKPFNWFTEFHDVMNDGGFDAVVGNPPYVRTSKVTQEYRVTGYRTEACPDIYAWFLERSAALVSEHGRTGMIVPLSLGFSQDFAATRSLLYATYSTNWFSHYGRIPAALFAADVRVRCVIQLGRKGGGAVGQLTTRLHRWNEVARPQLLEGLEYTRFDPTKWKGIVPKVGTPALMAAFEAQNGGRTVEALIERLPSRFPIYFKQSAYNWVAFSREAPPAFDKLGRPIEQSMMGVVYALNEETRAQLVALLNSSTYFAYWLAVGDDFHLTKGNFEGFPAISLAAPETRAVADRIQEALQASLTFKLNAGKRIGNFNTARCRDITDDADRLMLPAIGEEARAEIALYLANTVKTDFDDGSAGEPMEQAA